MSVGEKLLAARRQLIAVLEGLAGRDKTLSGAADGVEEDMLSCETLIKRFDSIQLNHKDVQEVFAHLLDHVIGESMDVAEAAGDPPDLFDALDDYMEELGKRLSRKISGGVWAPRLVLVFENYWADSGDSDDSPEDEEEYAAVHKSIAKRTPGLDWRGYEPGKRVARRQSEEEAKDKAAPAAPPVDPEPETELEVDVEASPED